MYYDTFPKEKKKKDILSTRTAYVFDNKHFSVAWGSLKVQRTNKQALVPAECNALGFICAPRECGAPQRSY